MAACLSPHHSDDAPNLPGRAQTIVWLAVPVLVFTIGCSDPRPPVEAADTAIVDCSSLSAPGPCHRYEPNGAGGECIVSAQPPGFACDDGSECTEDDQCNLLQVCLGTPVICETDGNPCTSEACVEGEGCLSEPATPGTPCEDGNPCTVNDTCGTEAACTSGQDICGDCDPDVAQDCDKYLPSANRCMGDVICTAESKCVFDAATAKAPCDTSGNNGCQTTGCDPSTGECATVLAAAETPCDDGNPCSGLGACDGTGSCSSGQPLDCADADDACTADYCVVGGPVQGCLSITQCECEVDEDCVQPPVGCVVAVCQDQACVFEVAPDGARECDAVWCTEGDACAGGVCSPGASSCDDDNPCTTDLCLDGANECVYIANVGSCDDGDPCTTGDACREGAVCEGDALVCDDHEQCTVDTCDPAMSACAFTPKMGPCDDGDACTTQDFCNGGVCKGGAPDPCEDDNPCTDDACDSAAAGCVHTANTASCDDGDACTVGDSCAGSTCQAGAPRVCDDDLACTVDDCHADTGCTATPDPTRCDDFDLCTLDTCSDAGCMNEATPGCCQEAEDCLASGESCVDAECTDNACVAVPVPGCCESPSDCVDDGDACTATVCDSNTCGHTPIASCCGSVEDCVDDGDACTATTCEGSVCVQVDVEGCCEDAGDCEHDGKPCTQATCAGGTCSDEPIPGCCVTILDCEPSSDPCAPSSCVESECVTADVPGCCNSIDDCPTPEPCESTQCVANMCGYEPVPDCCVQAEDCSDDGDACTTTECEPETSTCAFVPVVCDDQNACTVDFCDGGSCSTTDLACPPAAACHVSICDPGTGCGVAPADGTCDDDDPCTTMDTCVAGDCVGLDALSCDDDDPCTDDECVTGVGCTNTPTYSSCVDSDGCTADSWCSTLGCGPAIRDLRVGIGTACVLCGAGDVRCWGSNSFDAIQQGGQTSYSLPIDVALWVVATSIDVGEGYACAITSDAELYCWGRNQDAELARGYVWTGDGGEAAGPVLVGPEPGTALAGVTKVSAGEKYACALANQTVYCWGNNAGGRVDASLPVDTHVVFATPVAELPAMRDIDAQAKATCGVSLSGEVLCWGTEVGAAGVLGDGPDLTANALSTVSLLGAGLTLGPAESVRVGPGHACARLEDSTTACWGLNNNGQAGTPGFGPKHEPVIVQTEAGEAWYGGGAPSLGDQHSCARHDSCGAGCWGDNGFGQLLDGTGQDKTHLSPLILPLVIAAGTLVERIDAGGHVTCAALSDGSVICAGANEGGLLATADGESWTLLPAQELCSP